MWFVILSRIQSLLFFSPFSFVGNWWLGGKPNMFTFETLCLHIQVLTWSRGSIRVFNFPAHGMKMTWSWSPCLKTGRANMVTIYGSSTPYFFLHLPVIHELWGMIHFIPFDADFLKTIKVSPSHITPNMWSILRDFEIIYCNLGVSHTV